MLRINSLNFLLFSYYTSKKKKKSTKNQYLDKLEINFIISYKSNSLIVVKNIEIDWFEKVK